MQVVDIEANFARTAALAHLFPTANRFVAFRGCSRCSILHRLLQVESFFDPGSPSFGVVQRRHPRTQICPQNDAESVNASKRHSDPSFVRSIARPPYGKCRFAYSITFIREQAYSSVRSVFIRAFYHVHNPPFIFFSRGERYSTLSKFEGIMILLLSLLLLTGGQYQHAEKVDCCECK